MLKTIVALVMCSTVSALSENIDRVGLSEMRDLAHSRLVKSGTLISEETHRAMMEGDDIIVNTLFNGSFVTSYSNDAECTTEVTEAMGYVLGKCTQDPSPKTEGLSGKFTMMFRFETTVCIIANFFNVDWV